MGISLKDSAHQMSHCSPPATFAPPPERTAKNGPDPVTLDHASVSENLALGNLNNKAAGHAGRVLLLDDEPFFRDAVRDYLMECGFEVLAVESGVDGIKAVLAGDFEVILCDMKMPGLPGDLFYHAVERSRPHLCRRFVFMTGLRSDARANDFIKSVRGTVLMKPFRLEEMIEKLSSVAKHGQAPPDTTSAAADETVLCISNSASESAGKVTSGPDREKTGTDKSSLHAPVPANHGAVEASGKSPTVSTKQFSVRSIGIAVAGLALFGTLATGAGRWYFGLKKRAEASSAELTTLESRWTWLSKQVEGVEPAQRAFEATMGRAKRIEADRNTPRWTPALRSIAMAAGAGIELQDIQVGTRMDSAGARDLRIDGVARSTVARATADNFRQALEAGLKQHFAESAMTVRFERLNDAPDPAHPEQRRASFTIIATAGAKEPQAQVQNKGR